MADNSKSTGIDQQRDRGKEIVCKRALQQGNPLSPFLFILVADSLNIIIVNTRETGMLHGLLGVVA